jgi:hypothetical protein
LGIIGSSSSVSFSLAISTLGSLVSEMNKSSYLNNKGSIINYQLQNNPLLGSLINKLNENSVELNTLFDVNNGVQAYTVGEGTPVQTNEMKKQRIYHNMNKLDEDWKIYCDGSDISRYNFKWSGQYIKYGINLTRRRIPELFTGERIFVRQIPASMPYAIVSSFINIDVVCDNNYMIVRPKFTSHLSLKTLNGLLNSKMISFWFYFPVHPTGQDRLHTGRGVISRVSRLLGRVRGRGSSGFYVMPV